MICTFIIAYSIHSNMLALLYRPTTKASLLSSLLFKFSKKEKKSKKGEGAPKVLAKTETDYMSGP